MADDKKKADVSSLLSDEEVDINSLLSDEEVDISSPKSTAPSTQGGESGAVKPPLASTSNSADAISGDWTTEANPYQNKVQPPLVKPIDAVGQTKIVQPKKAEFVKPIPAKSQSPDLLKSRIGVLDDMYKGAISKAEDFKKQIEQFDAELTQKKAIVEANPSNKELIDDFNLSVNKRNELADATKKEMIRAEQIQKRIGETEKSIDSSLGNWESGGNSLSNVATTIKGFVPKTVLTATQIQGKIAKGISYGLGKILTAPMSDADAKSAQKTIDDVFKYGMLYSAVEDEAQKYAYDALDELQKEYKPTKSIVEAYKNGDWKAAAAGVFDGATSLLSTAATSIPTMGGGLYTEMIGDNIYNYNKEKAKSLGISVDELYNQDKDEVAIPALIGAISSKMEDIGLKGISKAINTNIAKKGVKEVFNFILEGGKEAGTEWAQTGLETYNKALGQGLSEIEAGKMAWETMTSEEGLEAALKGAAGSGAAITGGKAAKALWSGIKGSRKDALKADLDKVQTLAAERENPDLDEATIEVIDKEINNTTAIIQQAAVENAKQRFNLTEENSNLVSKIELEQDAINDEIESKQALVDNPNLKPETKAILQSEITALEAKKMELGLQVDEVIKKNTDDLATQIQEKRKELGVEFDPLEGLSDAVASTFERVEGNLPTDINAVQEASDFIYKKYKELQAMKSAKTRPLTIAQINDFMGQMEEDITMLENYKEEQRKSSETTLKKNTSPTNEKYGTVNRNDGKGIVDLTKEEYLKEGGLIPIDELDEQATPEATAGDNITPIEDEKNIEQEEGLQEVTPIEGVVEAAPILEERADGTLKPIEEIEIKAQSDVNIQQPMGESKVDVEAVGETPKEAEVAKEELPKEEVVLAEVLNDTNIDVKQNKIEGGLLNEQQSAELQKEIESKYNDSNTPYAKRFGQANEDIRQNLYNYDNPIAEKDVNGVNVRIAEGLIETDKKSGKKRKTYLLYADGKIAGKFYSVEDAKKVVKVIESNLIKSIGTNNNKKIVEKSENDKRIDLLETLTAEASDRLKEVYDEKDFNKLQKLSEEIATEIYDNYLKENNIPKDERKYVNEGDLDMIEQLGYRIISAADKKYAPIRETISAVDSVKSNYKRIANENNPTPPSINGQVPQPSIEVNKDDNKVEVKGKVNPKFKAAKKVQGEATTIEMPNGETREAEYMVVESDDILASHNETSFSDTEGYPTTADGRNANSRNYKGDKLAQLKVNNDAKNLKPSIVISDAATPDTGVPIVSEDGIVVSGNGRTMAIKLSQNIAAEKYEAYKADLLKRAAKFGLNPDEVAKMKKPILVKVDRSVKDYSVKTFDEYNGKFQKEESPIDKAIKRSSIIQNNEKLKERILSIIGRHETMTDLFENKSDRKELFDLLVANDIILSQETPKYLQPNGEYTADGKDLVNDILIATILSPETLEATSNVKAFRNKIINALPVLSANYKLGENSLEAEINDAIVLQSQIAAMGSQEEFWTHLRQMGMFDVVNPNTVIINRLINGGANNFKKFVMGYNKSMEVDENNLFGSDVVLTKQQVIDNLKQSNLNENEKQVIANLEELYIANEQKRPIGNVEVVGGNETKEKQQEEGVKPPKIEGEQVKPKTAKEIAKEKLDEARAAFRKTRGGLQSGGLAGIPEFINLVKAAIEYGIVSSKEFLKEFRSDIAEKYSDSEVEAAFDSIVNPPSGEKPNFVLDGEGKEKERSFTNKQFLADKSIPDNVKAAVTEDAIFYNELPNTVSVEVANKIYDLLGAKESLDAILDETNGMSPVVRIVLGQVIIRRAKLQGGSKAEADIMLKAEAAIAKKGTEYGQAIQAFSLFQFLSKEGQIMYAKKQRQQEIDAKLKKDKKNVDARKKAVTDINEKVIDEVLEGKVGEVVEETTKIKPKTQSKPKDYGDKNKIVTKKRYEELKKSLKGKFFSGVAPELIELGVYHIEAGSRKFADFSKAMIDDLGTGVKKYLKDLYDKSKQDYKDKGGDVSDFSNESEIADVENQDQAEKLAKFIVNRAKQKKQSNDPAKQMISSLLAKVGEKLPKRELEKMSDIDKIALAIKNREEYADVWEKSKEEVEALIDKMKVSEEEKETMRNDLQSYYDEVIGQPFSQTTLNKAVKQGLNELGIDVKDVIRKHYTVADNAKRTLVDKLVMDANLSEVDAKYLAEKVEREFNRIATERKKQALDKLKKPKDKLPTKKKQVNQLEDEIIALSNLGAFADEDFLKIYAEKMGWEQIGEADLRTIGRLAEIVEREQDGFRRARAVEDLLAFQSRLKGTSLSDVGMSLWYANVLSGPTTQLVNIIANTTNLALNYGINVAKDPVGITKSMIDGFRRGLLEGFSTLRTGYSPIRGKVETPNTLELIEFKNILKPANIAKYVRRVMVAADVLAFEPAKEMRAYQMARKIAREEATNDPTINQRQRAMEIMGNTKEKIDAAKLQAQEEYEKRVKEINNNSELTASEKKSEIDTEKRDIKRRVFELIEQQRTKTSADIIPKSEDYGRRLTYNYAPEGVMGFVAGYVNGVTRFKPFKFIIPFTNIIANVANESLNYSPLGFARAFTEKGSLGNAIAPNVVKGNEGFDADAKNEMLIKAAMGTLFTVALYAIAGDSDDDEIEITADGFGNYKDNYTLAERGWQPYSIRVGKTWISYQYTPFMPMFAFIGKLKDAQRYRKEKFDDSYMTKVASAAGSMAKTFFDSTFLSSMNTFFNAIFNENTERTAEDAVKGVMKTANSFVLPNFYTQVAKEVERKMDIPVKDMDDRYYAQLIKDIPFARNIFQNKVNALGDDVIPDTDKFISEVKPTEPNKVSENDLWTVLVKNKYPLRTLSYNQFNNNGIYDPIKDKQRVITPKEYYDYMKVKGGTIKRFMFKNYNELKSLDEKQFIYIMDKAKEEASDIAKMSIFKGYYEKDINSELKSLNTMDIKKIISEKEKADKKKADKKKKGKN